LLIGSLSKSQEATPSWPYSIMHWVVESTILNPEVHEAQFSYSLERTRIFAKSINCGAVQRNDEFSLLFKRMFGQLPDLG
jgi:hypothetical protein